MQIRSACGDFRRSRPRAAVTVAAMSEPGDRVSVVRPVAAAEDTSLWDVGAAEFLPTVLGPSTWDVPEPEDDPWQPPS